VGNEDRSAPAKLDTISLVASVTIQSFRVEDEGKVLISIAATLASTEDIDISADPAEV
jgi:hypothetical protein